MRGHSFAIKSVSYACLSISPSAKYIAGVGKDDGHCRIFHLVFLNQYARLIPLKLLICTHEDSGYTTCCFDEHSKQLIVGSRNNNMYTLSIPSLEIVSTQIGHEKRVNQVVSMMESVVSCSDDGTIRVWSIGSKKCVLLFRHCENDECGVLCIAVQNGKIVSGGKDGSLKLWSLESSDPLFAATLDGEITSLLSLPSSNFVASASRDKIIAIWDVESCSQLISISIRIQHAADVNIASLCYARGGMLFATFENQQQQQQEEEEEEKLEQLEFSMSPPHLPPQLSRFVLRSDNLQRRIGKDVENANILVAGPESNFFVAGMRDGRIILYFSSTRTSEESCNFFNYNVATTVGGSREITSNLVFLSEISVLFTLPAPFAFTSSKRSERVTLDVEEEFRESIRQLPPDNYDILSVNETMNVVSFAQSSILTVLQFSYDENRLMPIAIRDVEGKKIIGLCAAHFFRPNNNHPSDIIVVDESGKIHRVRHDNELESMDCTLLLSSSSSSSSSSSPGPPPGIVIHYNCYSGDIAFIDESSSTGRIQILRDGKIESSQFASSENIRWIKASKSISLADWEERGFCVLVARQLAPDNQIIEVWNVLNGGLLGVLPLQDIQLPPTVLVPLAWKNSSSVSPLFAMGHEDGKIRILSTSKVISTFRAHDGPVFDIASQRCGQKLFVDIPHFGTPQKLFSCGSDGIVRVWVSKSNSYL